MGYDIANCLLFGSFAPKCDFSSVNNIAEVKPGYQIVHDRSQDFQSNNVGSKKSIGGTFSFNSQ